MKQIKDIKNISPYTLIEECAKPVKDKNPVICQYFEKANDVPDPRDLNPKDKNLIVFDDLKTDKKQNICEDYYTKGRHNNSGCFYLSQNYFKIPRQTIRENTNFICLFEQDDRNLTNIYCDHASKDMPYEEFKNLCDNYGWQEPYDLIVIDKTSHKYNGRYRYKLDNFYYPL